MRNLILLRGSAGCGKSHWIKNNNLEQYTINADTVRLLIQSPALNIFGKQEISQKNDKQVWDLIRDLVKRRMERGEFTIVDATHSRAQLINQSYKDLCAKYRYRCYVVDFSDIPIEQTLWQNENREEYKHVPTDVIERMYAQILNQPASSWTTVIKSSEFFELFPSVLPKKNFDQYRKIHFVGDIHGCFDPLKEYFETNDINDLEQFYIFTGDYIDRGIQNKEVIEFLDKIKTNKNVLLLDGNHEIWLRMFGDEEFDSIRSKEFIKYTIPQIESIDKKVIREICRRLGQLAWFTYRGNDIFISHGGIPTYPSPYYASEEYIKGVGKYENYLEVENSWNKNTSSNSYQIHAHRNTERSPIINDRCFNLCDVVEFGGSMRFLQLDENGFHEVLIKNNTFYIHESTDENANDIPLLEEPSQIIAQFRNNRYIYEKKLSEHISSFNFTDKAFYDKVWNEQTVRARGLFANTFTNKVVARAYDKFFNIGENESVKTAELRRTLAFPVNVYLKYNGYLGIVGYDEENDDLWICSKSSNRSNFSEWFREILSRYVDLEKIKDFVKTNNTSMVFEVVDAIRDPHIIDYGELQAVVLLDVIYREFDYRKYDYDELCNVADKFGLPVKTLAYVFQDYNQFYDFYSSVDGKYNYRYNDSIIEGFVIEDKNGFMIKIKTEYYKVWKMLRGLAQSLAKCRNVDTRIIVKPELIKAFAFLSKLDREILNNNSIIQLRNLYLESQEENKND